jgi:hypothetical protein
VSVSVALLFPGVLSVTPPPEIVAVFDREPDAESASVQTAV